MERDNPCLDTVYFAKGNFSSISVGSGDAEIVVNGETIKKVNTYVGVDPASGSNAQPTVYMPIYYIEQVLQAMGIDSSWNGHTWSITTGTSTSQSSPTVLGFVTDYGTGQSLADAEDHSEVNEISTFTDSITSDGGVTGELDSAAEAYGSTHQIPTYVTVTNISATTGNFDADTLSQILNSPSETSTLVQNLTRLVSGTSYAGVNIDFEMLPTTERASFTQFLTELSNQLHNVGKKLSVDLPAVTNSSSAYDYAGIGAVSDQVILMAYDYSYPGGPAGPIAPIGWVSQVTEYATSLIPSDKILLGIPEYGYDWSGGTTTALTLDQVQNLISTYNITPSWDSTDEVPYFSYSENGVEHTVYYENETSTADELSVVKQYALQGIAIWRLGLENSAVWTPIQQMLTNSIDTETDS
ncbi:glycosyl hydrolase family 18 protein [Alicyclobacillus fastidiosus]|uniref:glycosyl hydrolase family 18 protein n=1 Tax=Alicyclobacillus fastidiosus TaxID=392011 RepID=UPI0023E9523B|nr:glycosyl hydrolase family 18 protein [Alicyclobacillus fastidiosus]GMA62634.1 chitinase [Alicyclobacillus fastidiosus]